MIEIREKESIAIIGGGIIGIAAAIELAKSGRFDVTIFEKENQLGGLSSYYQWQDVICDRFYHVILSKDSYLLDFIRDLGLESHLFWRKMKSGFYGDGRLASLSSIGDFIGFPFISLWQKFRLALGILYSAQIKNPNKLNKISARQWLKKIFGPEVYEKIWAPLLRSKFGETENKISAAFIWATIVRLYGTGSLFRKREKMGYVRGGYYTILNAAIKRLSELEVIIKTNAEVIKVKPNSSCNKICLTTNSDNLLFDKLLFTVPSPEIYRILNNINNHPYWLQMQNVEYLGVICILLILRHRLTSYYVINLLDRELPFTGIIESTNIISPEDIGNKYLIYLPKYLLRDDPMNNLSDAHILELFMDKLNRVFPNLRNEIILHKKIFRERYVQPIRRSNFYDQTASVRTSFANIYVANTSLIFDSTNNNNAAINLVQNSVRSVMDDMKTGQKTCTD